MTAKPNRADLVRQRRSSRTPQRTHHNDSTTRSVTATRRVYSPDSIFLPVEPRETARRTPRQTFGVSVDARAAGRVTSRRNSQARAVRNSSDYSFSLGRADVRAPALSIPQMGPRWISAVLTLALGFLLYSMWNGPFFEVSTAQVRGNQRLGAADINTVLGMAGEPVFKAVPADIEYKLRNVYPDLYTARVRVGFPNHIVVDIVERTPVLAWYQNGGVTWIDPNGVAFLPRGDVQGLIQVSSNGIPPRVPGDEEKPVYEQAFLAPDMVKAMQTLAAYVPAGVPMTYDPKYGMGWQDTRGWAVYFGQNTKDIPMKLVVYQSITDNLTRQGIQPSLISVEYLDDPFFK